MTEVKQFLIDKLKIHPDSFDVTVLSSTSKIHIRWLNSYSTFGRRVRTTRNYKYKESALKAFEKDFRQIYYSGVVWTKMRELLYDADFLSIDDILTIHCNKHLLTQEKRKALSQKINFLMAMHNNSDISLSRYSFPYQIRDNSDCLPIIEAICKKFLYSYAVCPFCSQKKLRYCEHNDIICKGCDSKLNTMLSKWTLSETGRNIIKGKENNENS
jgi:hypothetical protein